MLGLCESLILSNLNGYFFEGVQVRSLKPILISIFLTVFAAVSGAAKTQSDQVDDTPKSDTKSRLMAAAEQLHDAPESEPASRFERFAQWYNWNNWNNWHNWGNW